MLQGMGAAAMVGAVEGFGQAGEAAVFELRVYHANEGKLPELLARFREHTVGLFRRHGIESVGYWTAIEAPLAGETLFYLLKYKVAAGGAAGRAEAKGMWTAFTTDPEWKRVSAASEVNGKLVGKVESTFLELTDFSPRV